MRSAERRISTRSPAIRSSTSINQPIFLSNGRLKRIGREYSTMRACCKRMSLLSLSHLRFLKSAKRGRIFQKSINKSQITSNDEDIPPALVDVWNEGGANVKAKTRPISVIPAIEVEPLGCSFNPPFEAHQDSLAQAVADEMQKIYRKELAPQPVPLIVHGKVIDEDDKFFLDADGGDESDQEEDLGNDGDEGGLLAERKIKEKRITRVEQNRRARRKELLKAEAEVKKAIELFGWRYPDNQHHKSR